MADIDPELRDIIVKTHTIVGRMDDEFKEHKKAMHARLRDAKNDLKEHKKETKELFSKHDGRLKVSEKFDMKITAYASCAAFLGAFLIEPFISFVGGMIGFR